MELIIFWAAIGVVTGLAAQSRRRSFGVWLVLGLLFSLLALVAVLVMAPGPTAPSPARRATRSSSGPPGLVRTHNGVSIWRDDEGIYIGDRRFSGLMEAEHWVAAQGAAPVTTSARAMRRPVSAPGPEPGSVRLVAAGQFDQVVAGTSQYQAELARLEAAMPNGKRRKFRVVLTPDPGNAHDPRAVAVRHDGTLIGYLPREDAMIWHDDLADLGATGQSASTWAVLVGGHDGTSLGVRLDLDWPLERAE